VSQDSPREARASLYEGLQAEHGNTLKGLGYSSERSQRVRFDAFARFIDFRGSSVLDVGCGFGDFLVYLDNLECAPRHYCGVDLSEPTIERARQRHRDDSRATFVSGYLEAMPADAVPQADYVVISGSLNWHARSVEEHTRVVESVLLSSWARCGKALAFNMMNAYGIDRHADAPRLRAQIANYDPAHWLAFTMRNCSPRVVCVSDYHDIDFTIIAFRHDLPAGVA